MAFGNVFGSSGGHVNVNVTLDRIRASMASAKNNNANISPPWSPAPTWQVNTLYPNSATIRGTGSDSNNLYRLMGSDTSVGAMATSSTSGTGPTGETVGIITDGTCRWCYQGKVSSTGSTKLVSDAVLTSPISGMNGMLQLISYTTVGDIGLVRHTPVNFSTEAHMLGGTWTNYSYGWNTTTPNTGSAAVPLYDGGSRGGISFCTNAPKWIAFRGMSGGGIYPNDLFHIRINGRNLSETLFSTNYITWATGNTMLLNLASFPPGSKQVDIICFGNLNYSLAFEVWAPPDTFMWPTGNSNRFKLAVEGDSIAGGAYVSGSPDCTLTEKLATYIGCDDYYCNAIGGTGVINDSFTTKTTYLGRLQEIVGFAPDLFFINGFHNDVGESGEYTSVARRAAILTYLQAVRSQLPKCYIAMVGTQLLANESTDTGPTTQHQVELDAKWAFDQFNDSKSLFIPLLTDVKPRIINTNFVHYLVATAPYIDGHPIPQYYNYYAPMIADKIAEWLMGKH